MESLAASADQTEMELRNSDYDYSHLALADDLGLETCLSGFSSAAGSVYSLPPSEAAVELLTAVERLSRASSVYSQYSTAPSEAAVEMPEEGSRLRFPLTSAPSLDDLLQTAESDVETAEGRDSLDAALQTAHSDVDTAIGEASAMYSVYSMPPSETAVEVNEALHPEGFSGATLTLGHELMTTAPEVVGIAPVARDSLHVDFGATLVKVASVDDLLQTAVSETATAIGRDSLYSQLQTGISELDTAVRGDSLHSALQTGISEVATAVSGDSFHSLLQTGISDVATAINRDSLHSQLQTGISDVGTAVTLDSLYSVLQTAQSDVETGVELLDIVEALSEYSLAPSETDVEMPVDLSTLSFPLTTASDLNSLAPVESVYAFEAQEPAGLQLRGYSQYVEEELRDFQAWHEDNKVDDSVTVDPTSSQFVQMPPKGAPKMFASTASEYCVDNVE